MKKLITFLLVFCVSVSFGAEHTKKLKYRKGTETKEIKLYTTTAEVGTDRIAIRDGSTTVYAKIGAVGDSKQSDLRIRDGSTTKSILLSAVESPYLLMAGYIPSTYDDPVLKHVVKYRDGDYTDYSPSITWTPSNPDLMDMKVHPTNKIAYLCGTFSGPSYGVIGIATDGTVIDLNGGLGTGLNTVRCIEIDSDNGDIYFGGSFTTTAGGLTVNRIARYRPSTNTWYALGAGTVGVGNLVTAIKKGPDGRIYVGGGFLTAGGLSAKRFAVYNPTTNTWQGDAVWGGFDASLYGITFDGSNNLYVAGNFYYASGTSVVAPYFAKFNSGSNQWQGLGAGISAAAGYLTYNQHNNKIYGTGGHSTKRSFIYNISTNTIEYLTSGFNGTLSVIYVADNRYMYFGGAYQTADGITTNGIAKYDITTGAFSQVLPLTNTSRNFRAIQYVVPTE